MAALGTTMAPGNQNGLALLPMEILDMIFDNTDTPKATQLLVALTCKPLFQFLGSRKFIQTLSHEDRHELLVNVERDLTHRFLCFGCTRLHPLHPSTTKGWRDQDSPYRFCGPEVTEYWNTFKLLRPPQAMPEIPAAMAEAWYGDPADWGTYFDDPKAKLIQWRLKKIQSHSLCWKPRVNGPEIHFHEARQVLKRFNLGPPHGLPLSVLQRRFHFQKRLNLRGSDDLDFTDHFDEAVAEKLTQDFHENCASQAWQEETETDGNGDPGASGGTLWTFTHEYDARVSEGVLQPEGELLIRRRHRITGPVISADPDEWLLQSQDFARLLYGLELPVCRHLFCRSPPLLNERLFEPVDLELVRRGESLAFAARYLKSVRRFRGPTAGDGVGRLPGSVTRPHLISDALTSRVHDADSIAHPNMSTSCVQCNTDLTIALSTSVAGSRWALELTTYHNLGDCQRPDGKEGWGALNAWNMDRDDRYGKDDRETWWALDMPDCVRARWYEDTYDGADEGGRWKEETGGAQDPGDRSEARIHKPWQRFWNNNWSSGLGVGCIPFNEGYQNIEAGVEETELDEEPV